MKRETWTSKFAFILASVGSAIGLGNIWLFSWRVGSYGGASFLIPYIIFVFGIAGVGLMGEWAFGRSQKRGSIGAFENVFKEKKDSLEKFGTVTGFIPILAIYSVYIFYAIVTGWIIKYFFLALTGKFSSINVATFFDSFAGSQASIPWHGIALFINLVIVFLGVSRGIERANKIIMPLFFSMLIILLFRSLTLEGASQGIAYIFKPDWTKLAEMETWVMALGQAFFTLSLGGATMLVYGSYAKDNTAIPSAAFQTITYNFAASMLVAFVIMPAVFAFKLDPKAGPALLFITIPNIVNQMPGGMFFGIVFFLSVVFAALSSSISMLEPAVEGIMDKTKMSRTTAVIILSIAAFIIGLPLDTNMGFFGKWADIATVYILPFGALVSAFVFFWIYGAPRARAEINKGSSLKFGKWFEFYSKYIFVPVAVIVLVLNIIKGGIG
ncbi:MAG: sodium-dependent transporter [Deltaproteobacteria bacterium]|nr:MAG: sodium-dependent transporter [Deltaproteobacteria bacterium]